MNKRRIIFWGIFVVVLVLIIWGLTVAMNKPVNGGSTLSSPAPVSATDHVTGNPNAVVTLIEYGDFECPACGLYSPIVERLASESSSTLRVVFRHFPLSQHANAMITAEASEAASLQGKFWEMYKLIYDGQSEWNDVADAHTILDVYAQKIGLDMTKFKADIDSNAVKSVVIADQTEGQNIGIDQTPTFFINGQFAKTTPNYEAFKTLIETAAGGSSK